MNMKKCRVKTCPNFLHKDCCEQNELICNSHKCEGCEKDFKIGEINIAKCLVCEKAVHYDAELDQCQIIEEATTNMRKQKDKALD